MRGELAVGAVHLRLVAIRMRDAGAKVVADNQSADPAEELKHAHVTVEPHGQLLRELRERERIGARPERPDKELRRDQLPGVGVNE